MLPCFSLNSIISYSDLLIHTKSEKKTFTGMAPDIGKSADTVRRLLPESEFSKGQLLEIVAHQCKNAKKITLSIDDTSIPKRYSEAIEGTGDFYNTTLHQRVRSYKVIVAAITVNNKTFPIDCAFLWENPYNKMQEPLKNELVMALINKTKITVPHAELFVAMDGAFAITEIIKMLCDNSINFDMRMHKNRVVFFKGKNVRIDSIKELHSKKIKNNHTISAVWHGLFLFITSQKRIDKNGKETIVYLVSNYKTEPRQHVARYKLRWNIEKVFRTCKQKLGFSDCMSTKEETQLAHVSSSLLSYSLIQLERKKTTLKTPEDVIRAIRKKK